MARTREGLHADIIKAAVDACISKKRILSQSELTSVLKCSTTKLRSTLGDRHTTDAMLRKYLIADKEGKLLQLTPKKDIETETADSRLQQISQLQAENHILRKELNKIKESDSLEAKILDFMKEAVVAAPPVAIETRTSEHHESHAAKELLSLQSDIHGGESVSAEEMANLAEYNSKIMCYRYQYLNDHIAHKQSKYPNIDTLNIAYLGDMVSGTIHEELEITNDMDIIMSVFAVANMLAQGALEQAKIFKRVKIFGVPGNHGRLKKKPYAKRKYVNWDYVVYQIVKLMLSNQPNITCDFPKSIFLMKNILGDNYLFLHGDNIKSWNSVPFYGINRTKAQLADVLAARKIVFRNIFLGHFHNCGQLDRASGEIVLNGSMIGGNEFSLGSLFAMSAAKQLITCIEEGLGTTWRDPVMLDHADKYIAEKDLRYKQYEITLS